MVVTQAKAILISIALVVCAIIGMSLGSISVGFLPITSQTVQFAVQITASQAIGLGLVSILFMYGKYDSLSEFKFEIKPKRDILLVFGLTLLMVVASMVSSIISASVGVEAAENTVKQTLESDTSNVYMFIILSVLVVGPLEELFFRGTIQRHLKDAFTPILAVGLTALLFSSVHIFSMVGSKPIQFAVYLIVLLVGGFILGYSYEYTENLLVPMIGHGLYNAVLTAGMLM